MTESSLTNRKALAARAGVQFGGDRDLYEVFGYPRHLDVNAFVDLYTRQDIAKRIVNAYPDATWSEEPDFKGDEKFKASFGELKNKHRLWAAFHRLDRLVGLGHYGVLVLGLDGGEQMRTEAKRTDYNLLYVQPHSERTAQITQWEDNPRSPRFGMPKMYRITTGVNWTGSGAGQKTMNVHHSRCIHVAENALEDVSIGTPRLEPVYNRLMDLEKLLGGSAEMYWQNVAMLLAFMADADAEFSPEDKKDMESQLEEMQHGLRRALRLRGMDAKQLAPGLQGADPSPHVNIEMQMISGTTGVPQRILLGSESGELSSSQDENNWQSRNSERQSNFAGPDIIEPFIAKGRKLGFIEGRFDSIEWAEDDSLGEEKRAEIAAKKTASLKDYLTAAGAEEIVPISEFREKFLDLDANSHDSAEQLPDEADEADAEVTAQFNNHKARFNEQR